MGKSTSAEMLGALQRSEHQALIAAVVYGGIRERYDYSEQAIEEAVDVAGRLMFEAFRYQRQRLGTDSGGGSSRG